MRSDPSVPCPDPAARAPRVDDGAPAATARLHPPMPALRGALVATVWRDTRAAALTDAQRLTHFPASPLMSLSWFIGGDAGLAERDDGGRARWQPFPSRVLIAGSQCRPLTSWAPTGGAGGMATFTVDVARELFGLDPAALTDRFADAREVLGAEWQPMLDALLRADDDAAALEALANTLAPAWQRLRRQDPALPALRRIGRQFVERLAWQAHEWGRGRGTRQIERRIKAFSGRSLREWESLVRADGVFFAARERFESGAPVDWAALAQDEGFADQSHLVRATRRVTGFPPTEFARRFVEDESFWLYRLWV